MSLKELPHIPWESYIIRYKLRVWECEKITFLETHKLRNIATLKRRQFESRISILMSIVANESLHRTNFLN